MNEEWGDAHTHTHKDYSTVKNKEILPFVTTWMYLEGIILTKISQRKTNNYMLSLIYGIYKS